MDDTDDRSFWEKLVIDPENPNKKMFDLLVACCILLDFVFSSYSFFINQKYEYLVHIFTGILFVDILLRFLHGYFAGTKRVLILRTIVIHYLSGYFLLDFISTFPFYAINIYLYWFRFIRIVRFQEATARILDFITRRIIEQIFAVSKPTLAAVGRLIKFLITLIIFLHFFACAWVSWGLEENGWTTQKQDLLVDTTDSTLYLASLYWAITTFATIGYGDFSGVNTSDYLFSMGVFLFGVCMFSYLLGNVNGLVAQLNYEANIKSQQAEQLEEWLLKIDRAGKTKRLANAQYKFITNYLKTYWNKNIKGFDKEEEFVVQLPPYLRTKLITKYLFNDIRKKFQNFFEGLDPEFVKRLILSMEYFGITKDYRRDLSQFPIVKAGKVPKWIYFLVSGTVLLSSVDGMEMYMQLHPGGIFGEAYVLYGIPCSYSLVYDSSPKVEGKKLDANNVEMYRVNAEDYLNILKDFYGVYLILKGEAQKKRRIYRKLKRRYLENRIDVEASISEDEEEKKEQQEVSKSDIIETNSINIIEKDNEEPPVKPKIKNISTKVFDKKSIQKGTTYVLRLEYEYNSEDEFGEEDVFQKTEIVEPPNTLKAKLKELDAKMEEVKEKITKLDEGFTKRIDEIGRKAWA